MSEPTLSIVVIGRNEGARLERCLESAKSIHGWKGEVEILYVDSGSVDASCALARSMGCQVIELHSARPSAALGRNAGWRKAAAPVVLFLDGDTILDPDFPARATVELRDPRIAAVCGRRWELRTDASIYNRVLDLDWIGQAGLCDYCGGDALMRRDVLQAVGGYDDSLIAGEEPDMCRRMRDLGYRILYMDRPMTGHDLAMRRWRQYWRRAVRTGHAYAEVSARYADTEIPLWKAESAGNVKRGAFWALAWIASLAATVWLRNPLPVAAALALLVLLAARTAQKFQWKSRDRITLLFYGLHSHVQQLPILIGQLSYWRSRRRGQSRQLIEYKESGA